MIRMDADGSEDRSEANRSARTADQACTECRRRKLKVPLFMSLSLETMACKYLSNLGATVQSHLSSLWTM